MAARPSGASRLVALDLDDQSIARGTPMLAAERLTAIRDILAENSFRAVDRAPGNYRLRLSISDERLILDISDEEQEPIVRHILSLRPLARVMKDYFLVCESHQTAISAADSRRLEAIDMGRRALHNEGAEALQERLKGKIEVDFATARRLFTLICALSWRAPVGGSGRGGGALSSSS